MKETLSSLSLNVLLLSKILSFLATPDIVSFSIIDKQFYRMFQDHSILWNIALCVKPLGYVILKSNTFDQNIPSSMNFYNRGNCIFLLKLYETCHSTFSVNLLLSTLNQYANFNGLCIFIYSKILKLSETQVQNC